MAKQDDGPQETSDDRVALVKQVRRVYSGFFDVEEAEVSHPKYDGSRQTVTRLSLERGDSVGILLLDRSRRVVWLVEQFRYPTLNKGPGWLLEIPAGAIDKGETAEAAARRETAEEIGLAHLDMLEHVATFYTSPGTTSERLFLFFAAVDEAQPDGAAALKGRDPGEDIKVIAWDAEDFIERARLGRFDDAKTLIAGLWLGANRRLLSA